MPRRLVHTCFFVSGFAGLVYEIAWIRRASLVFGSTTAALSTVLAVFFGGLALGAWLFGRLSLRTPRPLRWYGLLEFGVAAGALASLALFGLVDGPYGDAWRGALNATTGADGLTWLTAGPLLALLRFLLVVVVLLVPTTLMGGTLPLFVRQFTVDDDRLGASVGFLYGLNTLGGVAGTLAAGFLLLPRIGITGAVAVAAAANVLAGTLALTVKLQAAVAPREAAAAARTADRPAATPAALRRLMPALFFAAGLTAVGAEVLWSRFLALVIRNSVITYTLTLAVVLAGIVLGSWLAGRVADRQRVLGIDRAAWYGLLQLFAGAMLAVVMFLPVAWWQALGHGLGPIVLLMLPGAAASGALFPLANRLVLDDAASSAAGVGRLTALNTVGGIFGSLVVGFAVLPHLGMDLGVRLLAGFALVAGGAALWLAGGGLAVRVAGCAVAVAAAWGLPALTGIRLPDAHLAPSGQLVDVTEGRGATLAAVRTEDRLQLQIDRLWQGSDRKGHQIMAAHVPALLHGGDPKDVLVIGVGVGQTAGRFLLYGIDHLDCVDIEPAIFPFIDRNFPTTWMHDPRVTLVPEDGRTFTAHTDRRYDIVSVEVGQVFRPGVDAFYTREFYEEARELLKPDGLVAQFCSLAFFGPDEFAAVLATFLEVFPDAVLWYNTQELLLIGSADGPPRLDPALLQEGGLPAAAAADLDWSHWGGPAYQLDHPGALLGGFLAAGDDLRALAAGGAVYRDDRPELAYATANAEPWQHREQPLAERIRSRLSPFAAVVGDTAALDPAVLDLAHRTRDLNLRDITAAGLLTDAVAGVVSGTGRPADFDQTLDELRQAVRANPENVRGWYDAGKILLMNRRAGGAVDPLARAARLDPGDGLVRRDLGLALLQTNQPQKALTHLQEAIRLRPDDAAAWNYLGAALGGTGDPAGAVRAFEHAVALDPADTSARQNLARARGQLPGGG